MTTIMAKSMTMHTTSLRMSDLRILLLAVSFSLAACGETATQPSSGPAEQSEHNHEEETGASMVLTNYTEVSELFVEFPPLVVGQISTFAAHVTRLSDHAPVTAGMLDVVLETRVGEAVARFRVRSPARDGLFTPGVAPRDAGEFQLAVEITTDDFSTRHELGSVTVFSDAANAVVTTPVPEGEISYLKEQQWQSRFASEPVRFRSVRASYPGFATVTAPADASATVRAPVAGYFSNATLTLAGEQVERSHVLGYLIPRLGDGTDVGELIVARERTRSQLLLARQAVDRLSSLYESGAVPERRLLEAEQERQVAEAEARTARERLEQYQESGSESGMVMRAPVGGRIVQTLARPGAFMNAGDEVFRIVSDSVRWVEVRIPEYYVTRMGLPAGLWLDGPHGTVIELDANSGAGLVHHSLVVDERSRTASVTFSYPAAAGPTALGASYPARVYTKAGDAQLTIPRSSIINEDGRKVVYVQTGGETFTRRYVETGEIDAGYITVHSGVQEGERVVSQGAYYVRLAAAGASDVGHGHTH